MAKFQSSAKVAAEMYGAMFLIAGIVLPIMFTVTSSFRWEYLIITLVGFMMAVVFYFLYKEAKKIEDE